MQTALGSFQPGYVDGYAVAVNSGGCVSASDDGGFAGVRRWGCSFGNPEDHGYESCNWDKSHAYDWFVCEN
jgi:hypothetical protein